MITIVFMLNGKPHALNTWPAVPRVGDIVGFPDFDARVIEVNWGIDEASWQHPSQLRVKVWCKSI